MSASVVSMPAFAPLFVPGEETVAVRWMTLTYPIDPELCRRALVRPLEPQDDPVAAVWIAEFADATFRADGSVPERRPAYRQAGVSLACRHDDESGAYALETFVGGLNYGILGRELFGLPKKQVRAVTLDEQDDGLRYAITDAVGVELLAGEASGLRPSEDADASPMPPWFAAHLTAKLIPSAEGTGYDVAKLVRIPWSFAPEGSVTHGRGTYRWAPSGSDPVHLLSPRGDAALAYGRGTLSIGFGRYVADLGEIEPMGRQQWASGSGSDERGER
ncbi:MAG: acetoacetate decarboxylase family protein [Patulibacter sp.]